MKQRMPLETGIVIVFCALVLDVLHAQTPTISSINPAGGAMGTVVTITGNNFGSTGGTVRFGGIVASHPPITEDLSNPWWTNTRIVVRVPPGSGTVNVTVTRSGGGTSNSVQFTHVVPPIPLGWRWPRDGATPGQGFNNPRTGEGGCSDPRYHTGVDVSGTTNIVRAAADGIVVAKCPDGSPCEGFSAFYTPTNHCMQGVVILAHSLPDGSVVYSLYAHLASVDQTPSVGSYVARDSPLGTTGVTHCDGSSSTHVHFEIKNDAVLHNPVGTPRCWGYTAGYPENYGYRNPNFFIVSTCALSPGQGAPNSDIQNKFINAYNADGSSVLGCATQTVSQFTNTFYTPNISGYFQPFQGGSSGNAQINYVSAHSSAYSIKYGFYQTFQSIDNGIPGYYPGINEPVFKLVASPTDVERSASSPSASGTTYNYQTFMKGAMYYYVTSPILNGAFNRWISYVWGVVSERYERENGRNGALGLPLWKQVHYGPYSGWDWWFQWFEKGFIWYAKQDDERWTYAYEYSGSNIYQSGSWTPLGWCQHTGSGTPTCYSPNTSLAQFSEVSSLLDSPPPPPPLITVAGSTQPTVTTNAAASVDQTSAVLNGTVNPNGLSTTYFFEYGTTTGYGSTTSVFSAGSGTNTISVNAYITDLQPNTTYHYRLVATNSGGTAQGNDVSFQTLAQGPTIAFTPTSLTFSASQGGPNPASRQLTVYNSGTGTVNWSITTNQYWLSVFPAFGTNNQTVNVSVDISGLAQGSYPGELTISAPGVTNSPQYVPISLTVLPTGVFSLTWQYKANLPSPRSDAASAVYDDKLHVFGGSPSYAHYRYDASTNFWSQLPNMPGNGTWVGGAAVIGTKIYVVDGLSSGQLSIYDALTSNWSIGPSVPTPRGGPVVVAANGKLFVIGGADANLIGTSIVEMFDPATNTWSTRTSMPTARGFAAGAVVDGLIYVIGGRSDDTSPWAKNNVEVYDPTTNQWTIKNQMPTRRASASATVVNNRIFVVGGLSQEGVFLPTVEEFDPVVNTWRTATPLQTGRMSAVTGTIQGKIYVAGGYDGASILSSTEEGTPTVQSPVINLNPTSLSFSTVVGSGNPPNQTVLISNYGGGTLNWTMSSNQSWLTVIPTSGTNAQIVTFSVNAAGLSVGTYNAQVTVAASGATNSPQLIPVTLNVLPVGNIDFSWQYRQNMPAAKYGAASAVANGKLHVIGGGGTGTVYTHYVFNPATNNWTTAASPPNPFGVSDGAAVEINGKIYVLSARPGAGANVGIYDPTLDSWTFGAAMQAQRGLPAVAVVGGKLYVIGGYVTCCAPVNTVEEYNPATNTWSIKAPMPTARYGAVAAVVNDSIYVIGGAGEGGNSVYKVEVYHPLTNTWREKPQYSTSAGRRFASAIALNNRIYLIGGIDYASNVAGNIVEYNPQIDTSYFSSGYAWRTLSPLQTARYLAAAGLIGNKIYIAGGLDSTTYNTLSSVEEGTQATFSVSGQVTVSGTGFNGVTLTLTTSNWPPIAPTTLLTQGNGTYSFGALSYGNYTITPTKTGYSFDPPYRQVLVSGGNQPNQNFVASIVPPNTWSRQNAPTLEPLAGVHFVDSRNGWAVSYNSVMLHTTDGGNNWLVQPLSSYYALQDVRFADTLVGWAVTNWQGKVVYTSNGGISWMEQFEAPGKNVWRVSCVDRNHVWVMTLQGQLLRTTNGGVSWNVIETGFTNLRDIFFLDASNGWLATNTQLLNTSDGGNTWTVKYSLTTGSVKSISFADPRNGWAAVEGPGFNVLRSTDSGNSWISKPTGISATLTRIEPADSLLAWAIGYEGGTNNIVIIRTTDGGNTWISQPTGTTSYLQAISYAENNAVAVGQLGTILHSKVEVPRPPFVSTRAVSSVGATSAVLVGTINPNSLSGTSWFEYSTDSTFQNVQSTSPESFPSGTLNQSVSRQITSLIPNTKYYYRIAAQNSAGTKRGSVKSFYTGIAPPAAPTLASPANGATQQPRIIELKWNASANTALYHLQVALEDTFATIVVEDSTIADTARQVGPLAEYTTYYWRVRAKNIGGTSGFTVPWNFRTLGLPTQVVLVSPENNAINQPTTLTFQWRQASGQILAARPFGGEVAGRLYLGKNIIVDEKESVSGESIDGLETISRYWYERVTDTLTFADLDRDTTLTDTTKTVTGLLNLTAYYWRVRANNEIGWGQFSPWWKFTTIIAVPAVIAVPISSGWNMISNPVTTADDSVRQLYPTSEFPYAYGFDLSGYYSSFRMFNGKGYWGKFASGTTQAITGMHRAHDTISVTAGWNMIGSISMSIDTSQITSIPPGLITSPFYGYDSGYVASDTIAPGLAYWVKVNQNGSLILSSSSGLAGRIHIVPTNEMPPPPPDGALEVSDNEELPKEFSLFQNYPNPFNPVTVIRYELPVTSHVQLKVYNILGQEVATLVDEEKDAGRYHTVWDGRNSEGIQVGSGVYFYRLRARQTDGGQAGEFVETKKLILLR